MLEFPYGIADFHAIRRDGMVYVDRTSLAKKGQELRSMDEAAVRELPAVKSALTRARKQVARYREALVRQRGDSVQPRGYAVVAVGLERLLGEEVTGTL